MDPYYGWVGWGWGGYHALLASLFRGLLILILLREPHSPGARRTNAAAAPPLERVGRRSPAPAAAGGNVNILVVLVAAPQFLETPLRLLLLLCLLRTLRRRLLLRVLRRGLLRSLRRQRLLRALRPLLPMVLGEIPRVRRERVGVLLRRETSHAVAGRDPAPPRRRGTLAPEQLLPASGKYNLSALLGRNIRI